MPGLAAVSASVVSDAATKSTTSLPARSAASQPKGKSPAITTPWNGGEEDTELDYAGRERDDAGRNDVGRDNLGHDDAGRDVGELTTQRIAADGEVPGAHNTMDGSSGGGWPRSLVGQTH
jgi:hypothetical protein